MARGDMGVLERFAGDFCILLPVSMWAAQTIIVRLLPKELDLVSCRLTAMIVTLAGIDVRWCVGSRIRSQQRVTGGMNCPSCQADNAATSLFCQICGAQLPPACSACGRANAFGSQFCSGCGASLTTGTAPPIVPLTGRTAERRVVTVMFCDLVGSTAMTIGRDPEDVLETMLTYTRRATSIIEANAGLVSQYRGDGIVAYFGYPTSGENDADRAIRAALELINAAKVPGPGGEQLSVHIGIATSLVVIGEIVRAAGADEHPIIGEAPNLAARLETLAEPDSIVVDDVTHDLAESEFEYADLGRHSLKGFREPVQVWRVLGEAAVRGQFAETRGKASLRPLVDREEEMGRLRRLWRLANAGEGQVVLLTGEPGIGKSRLALAFRNELAGEPALALRYFGSHYHTNSSLYPIINLLERAAGFAPGDPPAVKLAQLERLIAPVEPDVPGVASLLAQLLSIPTAGRYRQINLTAQRRRLRTIEALEKQLVRLAATTPILMVFEDLQWMDASTLEFIARLIERVQRLPVLILMTCRPEFVPAFPQRPYLTTFALRRLSRTDSAVLMQGLLDHSTLPEGVREQILARCDGVPLFVEEMTKSVLETGSLAADSDNIVVDGAGLAVPYTLYASLMARLDRLGPWRKIAQTAAVIGRNFSYQQLAALHMQELAMLDEGLRRLMEATLIVGHGEPPRATFTFKHALVQDVAYASLLRTERRTIHERFARALEESFPDTVAGQPEVIATHYTKAGMSERAIAYWQRAGELAQQRSANVEAIAAFERGLGLVKTLQPGVQRDRHELDLQFHLGAAFTAASGFAAPEVAAAYERARTLCQTSKDVEQRFAVLRGLWVYHLVQAHLGAADELAAEMLALAEIERNQAYELEAHRAAGMTRLWRGDLVPARDHLERGSRIYDPKLHHDHALRYGNDPGIACLVHEAFALWVLGYPDQAAARSERAIGLARQLAHPFSLAQALIYGAFVHQCRREAPLARKAAEEAKLLAVEYGFPFWLAEADIMAGWALATEADKAQGLARLRKGMDEFLATGARMDQPRWLVHVIEIMLEDGQLQAGLDAAGAALKAVADTREGFFEARLHQLQGELLLRLRGAEGRGAAEASFTTALEIARHQRARSWELRSATSLARLWLEQSRRQEARDLLAGVYGWFTEGFETADLKEAKALLEVLA